MVISPAVLQALAAGSAVLAFHGRGTVDVRVGDEAFDPLALVQALAAFAVQAQPAAPAPKKGRG